MTSSLSVINKTHTKTPDLKYLSLKNKILDRGYELSLVFIGDEKSKLLNERYRNTDKTANTLAFALSPDFGEIYINLRESKRFCKSNNLKLNERVNFLFVHSLLHLKGLEHGEKMETLEDKYCSLL